VEASKDNPTRGKDGGPTTDPFPISRKIYGLHAKEATEDLMEFLSDVLPAERITVMYFDEAHELGLHFWIFLRLVQHQLLLTNMWYAFMGTKANISYYAPRPSNSQCRFACLRMSD